MAENSSNEDTQNRVLPPVSALNAIASKCASAAKSMPSAMSIDAAKGLLEPVAKEFAQKAAKTCCDAASAYLKDIKPDIMKDLMDKSKKCSGGCSGATKASIEKKMSSCGGVQSTTSATATAAAPGFCPSESVLMYLRIQAAQKVAIEALAAATATLAATPGIVTMAEGSPAVPTITQLAACIGELMACLASLIETQSALLNKFY